MYYFDQKGFIYPITLALCLILPFYIINKVEMYKTELLFLEEQEELVQLQSIAQIGLKDISSSLGDSPISNQINGSFTYPMGSVNYSVLMYDSDSYLIQGKATTLKNRQYMFKTVIDIKDKYVEKWVEG